MPPNIFARITENTVDFSLMRTLLITHTMKRDGGESENCLVILVLYRNVDSIMLLYCFKKERTILVRLILKPEGMILRYYYITKLRKQKSFRLI